MEFKIHARYRGIGVEARYLNLVFIASTPAHEAPKSISCCLQDFVRLAKWEDRGYYAMKATTERNQRQLHRLTRRGEEALSQPAAAVLAAASKAMGFADLTDASNKAALGGAKGVQAGKSISGSKRKQAQSATLDEVWFVMR